MRPARVGLGMQPLDTTRPFRGSEAIRAGHLTRGLLDGPCYRRIEFDTYVAQSVPDSPLLAVRAALERAGSSAVATGWSACLVHGMDVAPDVMPVEIAVTDRRFWTTTMTVRRQVLTRDETTLREGDRVTTELRTAYDLACRSGPRTGAVDRVIEPLTDAVVAADALARAGGFDASDLEAFAARHPGARGVKRLHTVAALLDPRSDSPPETRARVKIVLAGLPRPELQHRVGGFFLDLAWPKYGVALEYDGRDHARSDRRGRDLDRLHELRRDGWIVIVVTARQLARLRWVPDRVRDALGERGWTPGPDAGREWTHVLRENARLSM